MSGTCEPLSALQRCSSAAKYKGVVGMTEGDWESDGKIKDTGNSLESTSFSPRPAGKFTKVR